MYAFYVEYEDDAVRLIENLTKRSAQIRYTRYGKKPERNAKGWGWMTMEEYPVSYEILKNRALKGTK